MTPIAVHTKQGRFIQVSGYDTSQEILRPRKGAGRTLVDVAHRFSLSFACQCDDQKIMIDGIAVGSGDVRPGDLFVAWAGARHHGGEFISEAQEAGAAAVLTDPEGVDLVLPSGLPVLVGSDLRERLGRIASWIYDDPSASLHLAAVTGTNGKTTTTFFIDAALRDHFERTALIGTVDIRIGDVSIPSPRTTVEAPVVQGIFARMKEEGIEAGTIEVSSHAMALHRADGFISDVAVFTNLQRDHLDYHKDMEGYFSAKAALFTPQHARRAVINVDDEWGMRLARECGIPVDTVNVQPNSVGHDTAMWRVVDETVSELSVNESAASTFTLVGPNSIQVRGKTALPGSFNVSNAVLAIVAAYCMGIDPQQAADAIAGVHAVPGRMEAVGRRGPGPLAVVDYAHTPDALELVLNSLRVVTPGRIIHVFGSDGDRDQGKRPIMGEISARLADISIVTDENPRSEKPSDIRDQIIAGARSVEDAQIMEADTRVHAVEQAVEMANQDDTIVLTGKGHEPFQEIDGVFYPQLDSDIMRAALNARWT